VLNRCGTGEVFKETASALIMRLFLPAILLLIFHTASGQDAQSTTAKDSVYFFKVPKIGIIC